MNKFLTTFTAAALSISFSACNDNIDASMPVSKVEIILSSEVDIDTASISNATFEFKNVSNGQTYSFSPDEDIKVIPGIYNISFTADVAMHDGLMSQIKAARTSVIIEGDVTRIELKPFISLVNDDFIISEVFFTGTLQSSGNQYYGDDYVKIYNNTDHVLYADGLTLFETKFLTTEKYNYTPDIMDEAVTVHALYTIPGSGKEHPVQPGEYLILADTGIDHRVINPNSFDLSNADWEWYDISTAPTHLDIDSPTTPNLDKWYCYTLSFWLLHNRGFKAYGLARIPVEKETFLKDYWYTYDYDIVNEAGSFPMSASAYKLPNAWIKDIVNCSVASEYAWNLCHPSLDSGWTFCGTIDKDKTRYFHSVRRKMVGLSEEGNPILQDTNNSSVDFNPYCIPSEIELQATSIDLTGTPCTSLTYDGLVPMPAEVADRYRRK